MFSLKEIFDKDVKVTLDPSWHVKGPGGRLPDDKLWCYEIVGSRGRIYPQSETEVCVETSARIAKKLIALFQSNCRIHRICDEGVDVVIPVKLISSVFRYIKPKKRKVLSPDQLQVLRDRLRGTRPPQK